MACRQKHRAGEERRVTLRLFPFWSIGVNVFRSAERETRNPSFVAKGRVSASSSLVTAQSHRLCLELLSPPRVSGRCCCASHHIYAIMYIRYSNLTPIEVILGMPRVGCAPAVLVGRARRNWLTTAGHATRCSRLFPLCRLDRSPSHIHGSLHGFTQLSSTSYRCQSAL